MLTSWDFFPGTRAPRVIILLPRKAKDNGEIGSDGDQQQNSFVMESNYLKLNGSMQWVVDPLWAPFSAWTRTVC